MGSYQQRLGKTTAAGAAALLGLLGATAGAKVLMTREEALRLAFPGARVERRTAYLTREQARLVRRRAQAPVESLVWPYYVAISTNGVEGYAYFETHLVRTGAETLMAVLDPGGRTRSVEILAFHEPEDYLPPRRWLERLRGRGPGDATWFRRGLGRIAGATLSSQAVAEALRRILAVHAVLHGEGPSR